MNRKLWLVFVMIAVLLINACDAPAADSGGEAAPAEVGTEEVAATQTEDARPTPTEVAATQTEDVKPTPTEVAATQTEEAKPTPTWESLFYIENVGILEDRDLAKYAEMVAVLDDAVGGWGTDNQAVVASYARSLKNLDARCREDYRRLADTAQVGVKILEDEGVSGVNRLDLIKGTKDSIPVGMDEPNCVELMSLVVVLTIGNQ